MANALGLIAPKYAAPADWKVEKVEIGEDYVIHRTGNYFATQTALDALVTDALAAGAALVYLDVPPLGFTNDARMRNPNAYYPTPALLAEMISSAREIADLAAAAADALEGTVVASDAFIAGKMSTLGTETNTALADFVASRIAYVTPEQFGAVGNGTTNDTAALQAAYDAAAAGLTKGVLLSKRYGWTGDLTHRGGITVFAHSTPRWIAGVAPASDATHDVGLFALGSTARYVYGTFGGSSIDDNPGALINVLIDGQNTGGSNGSLALHQGAQGYWRQVTVTNSVGHGVRLNGMAQNSIFEGCYFAYNVSSNLRFYGEAGFQGAGGNKFNNCYFGDSPGSVVILDAPDAGAWSHDTIFTNCLFEPRDAAIDNIIHAKIGDAQFRSCVITRSTGVGTTVADEALVLVDNSIWTTVSTTLTFADCYFNGGGAFTTDAIRAVATAGVANEVRLSGRTRVTNTDSVICSDNGPTLFSAVGTVSRGSGVAMYRLAGSGNFAGHQYRTAVPTRYEMPGDAGLATPIEVRRDTDTQPRGTIDRDGTVRWYDGATATVRASLSFDTANDRLGAGGLWRIENALAYRASAALINSVGQAVALSGARTATVLYGVSFIANNTSATMTISGGTDGSQVQVLLDSTAATGCTVTWPAEVSFAGPAPQPLNGKAVAVNLVKYGSSWYGTTTSDPAIDQMVENRITTGMEVFPREFADNLNNSLPTGTVSLTYFTAYKTMPVASLRTAVGNTAAAATPTLCKMGLYSVAANGDLTLIASTANDTTLWSAVTTIYTKALAAGVTLQRGQRYALACLVVTSAAAPMLICNQPSSILAAEGPRLTGQLGSQTDLPASITAGSVVATNRRIYGECL